MQRRTAIIGPMNTQRRITLKVSHELHAALWRYASYEGRTMQKQLTRMLEEALPAPYRVQTSHRQQKEER